MNLNNKIALITGAAGEALAEAAKAHRALEARKTVGATVLVP